MKQHRGRGLLLPALLTVCIALFLLLSVFFNTEVFRNSFREAKAYDSAQVAEGVISQLENTLKYGKTLENYYGMDSVFSEIRLYCKEAVELFITDSEGNVCYLQQNESDSVKTERQRNGGFALPDEFSNRLTELKERKARVLWRENGRQYVLLPISQNDIIEAVFGFWYPEATLQEKTGYYRKAVYMEGLFSAAAGIFLFWLFCFFTRKNKDRRNWRKLIVLPVLLSNLLFGLLSFQTFKGGYLQITQNTADVFQAKFTADIDRVISAGVPYKNLKGMDTYFASVLGDTGQISEVRLTDQIPEKDDEWMYSCRLSPDRDGKTKNLVMTVSGEYVDKRLRKLLINMVVSIITSLMFAAEVVSFLLAVFTDTEHKKRKTVVKEDKTRQPLGLVRGLSFFFALFEYMAIAFVSIVLTDIYKPISVFGCEISYDMVMSLPLTIQILTSLLSAWLSGRLIGKKGWKPIAVSGMLIMAAGTFVSAVSREPYLFLFSQMIIGIGLGLSRTAFDVYAVLVASEADMERYTSNANAGIIVGLSCASSLGALLASSVGYAGTYMVMGGIGCVVVLLVEIWGQNIVEVQGQTPSYEGTSLMGENTEAPAETLPSSVRKSKFDIRFAAYLLFMVLPYFFITMYVDYFFPVYANQQGMGTEVIGYVFLAYGLCTSYPGVWICNFLSKHMNASGIMVLVLGIVGGGIFVFSVHNFLLLSVLLVLLIAAADGVMPSQQFKYVYALPYAKQAGFAKALSLEGIFSSGIRGVAPLIFGYVMMKGNTGLMTVAVLMLMSALLFGLLNRICSKRVKTAGIILLLVLPGTVLPLSQVQAQSSQEIPVQIMDSPEKRILKLGYCQSESYYEFDKQLYYLIRGMEEFGIIPPLLDESNLHEDSTSQEIWDFISRQEQKNWKVKFIPEYYLSLDSVTKELPLQNWQADLILTMGTKAGLYVKEEKAGQPFMNFMAANPVDAGIVKGMQTSKEANCWAQVDPENFSRSISIMYDIFRPGKIGVVYADHEEAYSYSGAKELDSFCKGKKITILREHVEDEFETEGYQNYVKHMRKAHEKLAAEGVDLYILTTSLLRKEDFSYVLEPFYKKGIPIYSINSITDVENGALMAIETSDYRNIGRFGADMLGRFEAGEALENLNQIYQTAPYLVINYTVAEKIGYQPDFTMLSSASRIYR